MRLFKSREEKEQIDASRAEWDEFVRTSASGEPLAVRSALAQLQKSPNIAALSGKERRTRADDAFRQYASNVLADDHVTEEEEAVFGEVCDGLGISDQDLQGRFMPVFQRLVVSVANDGRLSVLEDPQLIAKKNENVHLETSAGLTKEVVQREWRGGSSGFSFRIAKGVRYHVGGVRGKSIVVGSQVVIEDTGFLAVTSQRAVYVGSRKSVEFAYPKLLNMEVFSDGIRFQVSNRQNATLFQLSEGMGDVVAATVNAAMQQPD